MLFRSKCTEELTKVSQKLANFRIYRPWIKEHKDMTLSKMPEEYKVQMEEDCKALTELLQEKISCKGRAMQGKIGKYHFSGFLALPDSADEAFDEFLERIKIWSELNGSSLHIDFLENYGDTRAEIPIPKPRPVSSFKPVPGAHKNSVPQLSAPKAPSGKMSRPIKSHKSWSEIVQE